MVTPTEPYGPVRLLYLTFPMRPSPLLLLLLTFCAVSCSQPEGLHIGEVELSWEELDRATEELSQSFPQYTKPTLHYHLLMFGLGETALLHAQDPAESQEAFAAAKAAVERLEAGKPFLEELAERTSTPMDELKSDGLTQPNPASLGARAAAATAVLEPGQWRGPIRTLEGWEIVYLRERTKGTRHRANVDLYRLVYPIGSAERRLQAKENWATLPLRGNLEVIRALPLEFRRGRTPESP